MKSTTQTIDQIFSAGVTIEVPFFQRSYVWKEKEWEKFISDMTELCRQKRPYFLGAIILKKLDKDGKAKSIVDGQQRLTTLLTLLKVLSLKTEETKYNFYFTFATKQNGENRPKLNHSYYDSDAFKQLFNIDKSSPLDGKNQITRAYNYFHTECNENQTLDYQTIVENVNIVSIEIEADEDEQQIFETINSVGCKLTTGELLKNYIFKGNDIENYKKIWVPVFEKDDECIKYWDSTVTTGRSKRSNTESFFHAFLQIKMQSSEYNVPSSERLIFRKAESVFNNYRTFITKHVLPKHGSMMPFAKEIAEYAKIFRESFEVDYTHTHVSAEPSIARINFIIYTFDASTMIPYVMYVLKNVNDVGEQAKIFELLETYIVRRAICKSVTKSYSDLFNEELMGKEVKTYDKLKDVIENKASTNLNMPDNKVLSEAFRKNILNDNQAKGVLYLLESKLRSDKKESLCLNVYKHYELEHLMPKKWAKSWPLPEDQTLTKQDRDEALKTMGNLMIISGPLNGSISNADWTTKKNGTNKKDGLLRYASDLQIWNGALDKEEWNEDTIRERADKLAEQAKKVWMYHFTGSGISISFENGVLEDPHVSETSIPKPFPTAQPAKTPLITEHPKLKGRDCSKFSINGSAFLDKRAFVRAFVGLYMRKYPEATYQDLKNFFPNSLLESNHRHKGLFITVNDWNKWNAAGKPGRYYVNKKDSIFTSSDGIEFYVNTQWTLNSIKKVIKLAEKEGFTIKSKE